MSKTLARATHTVAFLGLLPGWWRSGPPCKAIRSVRRRPPGPAGRATGCSKPARCVRWPCRPTAACSSPSTRPTTASRSSGPKGTTSRISAPSPSVSSRSPSLSAQRVRSGSSTTSPTASASSSCARRPRQARVVRTLLVGDEPRDIVFAGPGRSRAFITTAHRGQNSPVDPQLTTPGVGRADVWVFDADASAPRSAARRSRSSRSSPTRRARSRCRPTAARVYAAGVPLRQPHHDHPPSAS